MEAMRQRTCARVVHTQQCVNKAAGSNLQMSCTRCVPGSMSLPLQLFNAAQYLKGGKRIRMAAIVSQICKEGVNFIFFGLQASLQIACVKVLHVTVPG